MKKTLCVIVFFSILFITGCYDASEVEETAYLIALGLDNKDDNSYSYTFQFAAPLAISGGGEEGGGGGGGEEPEQEEEILDSKNPTVKNIVIEAPDFYTAKNKLSNYLSKTLNMSHLKMIVCSDEFSKEALKKHGELFLKEREIRPGTFVAVSSDKAEQFLKLVNPDLEGSTSKYYELSNSEKTLIFAPSMRLGDFLNGSETFDKSTVLPIAIVDKEKISAELFGMGIFKDGKLIGKVSGEEALIYNILTGNEKRFTFSVNDKKNAGETLSFDNLVLKAPNFKILEEDEKLIIITELYLNTEFIGAKLPKGYGSAEELILVGEKELEKKISDFLIKISRDYSADILKIERYYKKQFFTIDEIKNAKFNDKYKTANFKVIIKRSNKGGSTISGEIN